MSKIGKYEILEKIGVGGFGEVYKAWDPFIKRHVAVKTCVSEDQSTRDRFFREAEIAGRLSHRNITTVYDFGVEGELPYLIQEYLSGEDLDRKVKRRDYLPYPEKLHYLIQIARGLAYAHQQGVIHRDVKPANIRILEDGTVKIMDFGIAKLAHHDTDLTKTGMAVGTAAYLAPEQIRGEPVGHRTDVFSYGILAYELLTLKRPFQGDQISAVIYEILNREPPPIRDTVPTAPAEILELVARCLAKDPKDRFEDASAVLRFLEIVQKKGREREGEEASLTTRPIAETPAPLAAEAPAPPAAVTPPSGVMRSDAELLLVPEDVTSAQPTIDDLELTSVRMPEESSRSRPVEIQGAASEKPSYARYAVLLILLPVVALAAGLTLGDQERREAFFEGLGSLFGVEEEAPQTAPPAPPEEEATPGETAPEASGEDQTPDEGEAAPPPPVEPGSLIIPKVAWTEGMTVRVGRGGRRYPLSSDRTFPLPPNTYTVTFELDEPDYQASETHKVSIREGEKLTLQSKIPRPALLTVRAGLGKAQGRVIFDGEDLGSTPIRKKAAPAEHRLRIAALNGEGDAIETTVGLMPGQETVLTFDLDSGSLSERTKDLEIPPSSG